MTTAALLTLVATVLRTDGALATVGHGFADGLRPGDRGQAYYVLLVGTDQEPRRIEVGPVEVVEARESSATVSLAPDILLRAGSSVEFEVPASRTEPPRTEPEPVRRDEPAVDEDMAFVPGSTYSVGVDLGEARFYNQHPRFRVALEPYRIDRRPAGRGDFLEQRPNFIFPAASTSDFAVAVTYGDAQAHCRRLGKRLPSELEWEVAARRGAVEPGAGLYEWTVSWYQPYPGNRLPEEEFGETYRVLRGSSAAAVFDPRVRHFIAPDRNRNDVGFRCAVSLSP